jgi:hypothetical protein
MDGNKLLSTNNWKGLDLKNIPAADRHKARSDKAFKVSAQLPVQSAREALDDVLANAGAILPVRDAVDARIVNEVKTRKATGMGSFGKPGIIDNPEAVGGWPVYNSASALTDSDHDGMPDEWERNNGLDPNNATDRNKLDANGYTMLEKYLNELARPKTARAI